MPPSPDATILKGECSVFLEKKIYIMDENNSLSEYIKIPLGHNAPFTPKSTSKLRSALHFSYSIVIRRFYSRAIVLRNLNSHYNHGFPNTFTPPPCL